MTDEEIERQCDVVSSLFDAEATRIGWTPGHSWYSIRFALKKYVRARGTRDAYDYLKSTISSYYRDEAGAQAILSECMRLARSAMREEH